MARYKDYNYAQSKMIPISFREQILPGTFEHTLSQEEIIEEIEVILLSTSNLC